VGSIDGRVASHECPTRWGLGSAYGELRAIRWQADRIAGSVSDREPEAARQQCPGHTVRIARTRQIRRVTFSAVPAHPGGECRPGTRRLRPKRCDRIPNSTIGSPREQTMADASAQHSASSPATVAEIMHPPVTTVAQNDHVAAAAYLMKRADATALIVTQGQTGEPIGIITEADISHAVADGKNPNDVRIYQLMTARPTVVGTAASIRDAAKVMTSGRFRHLPVMGETGLVGIVDITDVCRALLDVSEAAEEPPSDP